MSRDPCTDYVPERTRKSLLWRDHRYIVSSRRNNRVYYKCTSFRKGCKARLVIDLSSMTITPSPSPHIEVCFGDVADIQCTIESEEVDPDVDD